MSGPANPDWSLEAKKQIAKATRTVLGIPEDNGNVARPAYPRGGGGQVLEGQYYGQVFMVTSDLTTGAAFLPLVNEPPK